MKKVVFIVLLFTLMITSCSGSAANSMPVATGTPMDNSMTPVPSTVVAAPGQTSQPVQNADGKVEVQVTEGDNWIKSNQTTFKVGVKYVFIVTNTGHRAHIFSISHPAEKTTDAINAAKASALVLISDQQLLPGSVVTVEYTFTQAAPAGSLEFACLIPMHYKMGQYLPIIVE
jgi:uncharacterized cupredoxin-like copper-binding protein